MQGSRPLFLDITKNPPRCDLRRGGLWLCIERVGD